MTNPDIDIINKRLADRYGSNLKGEPHFRVIWSDDIFETRVGRFNEFRNGLFIRSYTGAKSVRKYNYLHHRWILEMWKLTTPIAEIPEPDGYEPVFVFENSTGQELPVRWEPIIFVCECILNPWSPNQVKQAIVEDMEKKYQDEVDYFYDMFDITKMQSQFMDGSAIILPGKDINADKN